MEIHLIIIRGIINLTITIGKEIITIKVVIIVDLMDILQKIVVDLKLIKTIGGKIIIILLVILVNDKVILPKIVLLHLEDLVLTVGNLDIGEIYVLQKLTNLQIILTPTILIMAKGLLYLKYPCSSTAIFYLFLYDNYWDYYGFDFK